MDADQDPARVEQARVRQMALGVHAGALFALAVLVGLEVWLVSAVVAVIAVVAGAWALKMHNDLQQQIMADRAAANAAARFLGPDVQ
jgi:hypothetical protein